MAQQEYPTLDGVEPSWADIALTIAILGGATLTTKDFSDIKWSDKVNVGVVRGANGGRILRRTTGEGEAEASMTLYKSGWRTLRTSLASVNRKISLVGFDLLIQHTPPGESLIHTVKIIGCRVVGRSGSSAEGTDAEKIEVPLSVMRIEEDGVSLL